jgi:hypothetical protein
MVGVWLESHGSGPEIFRQILKDGSVIDREMRGTGGVSALPAERIAELKQNGGYMCAFRCEAGGSGHYHVVSAGRCDPEEMICMHSFRRDNGRDALVCANCDLSISGETMAALGGLQSRYDRNQQRMADEATSLRIDVTALKVENSDLRRTVERLERKR